MSLFDEAKRVALPLLAAEVGAEFRKSGKSFASRTCPRCGEGREGSDGVSMFVAQDGVWRWNCFRCKKGGTVIDYAAAAWGITDIEAARRLAGRVRSGTGMVQSVPAPEVADNDAASSVFRSLMTWAYTSTPGVVGYLRDRGISQTVIDDASRRCFFRTLPMDPHEAKGVLMERIGEGVLRKAGMWRERWPAIAYRPLICFFPGGKGAEFRLARDPKDNQEPKAIRYGTLEYPFFWRGSQPNRLVIVEGAIDLLTKVTMGEKGSIIGLPGATSWKPEWFDSLVARYPDAEYEMGMHIDDAGAMSTAAIVERLARHRTRLIVNPPPVGKDWNDAWKAKVAVPA